MPLSFLGRLSTFSLLCSLGLACSANEDAGADCEVGAEGCACYQNKSCNSGLECHSEFCVDPESSGNGSGGAGGSGGASSDAGGSGGSSSDAGGSGGSSSDAGGATSDAGGSSSDAGGATSDAGGSSNVGGSSAGGSGGAGAGGSGAGGSDAAANSTDSGGTAGAGGGSTSGTGGGATTGTGGTTTTGGTGGSGSDVSIIDDFASCDGAISPIDGRDGGWFTFGDEDVSVAPSNPVLDQAPPGGVFDDSACSAWYTAACSEPAYYCDFAGLGFVFFEDESPYDLSGYQGLSIRKEGAEQWIVVHMGEELSFGATLPSTLGTHAVYFYNFVPSGDTPIDALPDWSQVTKIEFTAVTPGSSSELAIYDIRLL